MDRGGRLTTIYDLHTFEVPQADLAILSALGDQLVGCHHDAVVEREEPVRLGLEGFPDALVDLAGCRQERSHVQFKQTCAVSVVELRQHHSRNDGQAGLVLVVDLRDVDTGNRSSRQLDEVHLDLVTGLACFEPLIQPLDVEHLQADLDVTNSGWFEFLLTRDPVGQHEDPHFAQVILDRVEALGK